MRTLLCLLLFVSLGGCTASSYTVRSDMLATLDAYSRAANIQPLESSAENELRVWTRGFMQGRVVGYVLSKSGALKCRASSSYKDGVVALHRASCRPRRVTKDAFKLIGVLSALNGRQWDCPRFDGYEIYIGGVYNGRIFALRVGNPDACNDPNSKKIAQMLRELH